MTHTAPHPIRRDTEGGLLGGVCAGLAPRVGLDAIVLRVVFVVMALAGGTGLGIYGLLWFALPDQHGRRAPFVLRGGTAGWRVAGGMACLVLAALLLLREWGLWVGDALAWPIILVVSGAALVWRQTAAPWEPRLRLGADARGRAFLGAALVVGGGLVFLWLNDALRPARDVILAVVVVVVAAGLILAPWWVRLVRGLSTERAARIRSQERAEVAAHLHDSVLQTLALVQKRAEDPREVANLARRQERELRAWLNGGRPPGAGETLVAALERAAEEVEDTHRIEVDVVTVGDAPLDAGLDAVAAAAREALHNAAKHGGGGPVSLYAEVSDGRTEVFVRDRGAGFDLAAVPDDRRGVRESILGRMERHGGRAAVHSSPETGTEVELVMPR